MTAWNGVVEGEFFDRRRRWPKVYGVYLQTLHQLDLKLHSYAFAFRYLILQIFILRVLQSTSEISFLAVLIASKMSSELHKITWVLVT